MSIMNVNNVNDSYINLLEYLNTPWKGTSYSPYHLLMKRSKRMLLPSTKLMFTPKITKLCQKTAQPKQKCSNFLLQHKHQNVGQRHRLCQILHEKTNGNQVLHLKDHIIQGHALQKQNGTIHRNRRHIDDSSSYDIEDDTTVVNMETNTKNNVNEKISALNNK